MHYYCNIFFASEPSSPKSYNFFVMEMLENEFLKYERIFENQKLSGDEGCESVTAWEVLLRNLQFILHGLIRAYFALVHENTNSLFWKKIPRLEELFRAEPNLIRFSNNTSHWRQIFRTIKGRTWSFRSLVDPKFTIAFPLTNIFLHVFYGITQMLHAIFLFSKCANCTTDAYDMMCNWWIPTTAV